MFLIIPFMEFLLPFALKLFPNMLPSTFQETLKVEENMKRELKTRIAMTGFFQETLGEVSERSERALWKTRAMGVYGFHSIGVHFGFSLAMQMTLI